MKYRIKMRYGKTYTDRIFYYVYLVRKGFFGEKEHFLDLFTTKKQAEDYITALKNPPVLQQWDY